MCSKSPCSPLSSSSGSSAPPPDTLISNCPPLAAAAAVGYGSLAAPGSRWEAADPEPATTRVREGSVDFVPKKGHPVCILLSGASGTGNQIHPPIRSLTHSLARTVTHSITQ
eukprot:GHVU01205923.1.p4 GENE.GHVU01205923.1~~GHVU01205923.1.p4  ORF type:complete len:112 (+),score=8.15 GHVU01205923.1:1075-1410(+)